MANMDLTDTSTTKHKQAEFAEPCIFKPNSSDNAYDTTSPQGTEHRVCSEDEFAEQRLSSHRGSDPISRPQAGKSNMHNQAHDNSCYCQEAAAPEGSSLVSQGNGDGIAESMPHAMRGISRSGMPIRNDKACNQNACDEETEDASRSAFQRDYEGGELLPQASQARRDSPDRYTLDSGPESLSGGSGGSTNGLLHVDSFALGMAQHDPLDLMMGALADMHEVFHDVPAEDDDTDINELIHTHSTASSDVAAHGSHHHAAGIPTLQSPSANTGALDAVQSHPGHAGADSADGNALSPAAVHAAGRALETALLHAAVQSTVSAVQPMVGDAAAGPLQGMGSPPGRMRLAAAAAAAGLGAVPPTPLPRRLKRKLASAAASLASRRLLARTLGPRTLLLRDKLSFLVGTTLTWVCAYWLGVRPQTFYMLYCGIGAVMMAARWLLYLSRKWHYYLFDFCYYANLLLVVHLWLLPNSPLLAKVTFAYNTGPLTWSIVTFRNSLVFHDLDKVTSLFLHLGPSLVSYAIRWWPHAQRFGAGTYTLASTPQAGTCSAENGSSSTATAMAGSTSISGSTAPPAGLRSMVLLPMGMYVMWAVVYYLKIFVWSAGKIQRKGYKTLFSYVTSQSKGAFHEIARRIPPQLQPPVYLLLHLCFCTTTCVIAWACWSRFALHSMLVVMCFTASLWHGGVYYFEVFAKRYQHTLAAAVQQMACADAAAEAVANAPPPASPRFSIAVTTAAAPPASPRIAGATAVGKAPAPEASGTA